jgi:hypothetical protein
MDHVELQRYCCHEQIRAISFGFTTRCNDEKHKHHRHPPQTARIQKSILHSLYDPVISIPLPASSPPEANTKMTSNGQPQAVATALHFLSFYLGWRASYEASIK